MVNRRGFLTFAGLIAPAFSQSPNATANETGPGSPWALAWETLDKSLRDGDPEHRKEAIAAVGTIGNIAEARKRVEQALTDKGTEVRQTAAGTLAEMQARESVPALQAALDDNPEVSFAAAKALWDLGDDTGRWVIQQVLEGDLKDAPGRVQGAVRDAKKKLHKPSELAVMGAKEATGQFLGPASLGIKIAQQAMKDGGAPGRVAAAGMLAKDSDPYALTLLEWALTDKSDKSGAVRAAIAKALGVRGNEQTIPKLVPSLSDDRNLVRVMSAASIIRLSVNPNGRERSSLKP
jgi:HEAT repeat protein